MNVFPLICLSNLGNLHELALEFLLLLLALLLLVLLLLLGCHALDSLPLEAFLLTLDFGSFIILLITLLLSDGLLLLFATFLASISDLLRELNTGGEVNHVDYHLQELVGLCLRFLIISIRRQFNDCPEEESTVVVGSLVSDVQLM